MVLVLHCSPDAEASVLEKVEAHTKRFRVKSRNFTERGLDMVLELSVKDLGKLSEDIRESEAERFSIIEYDSDDVL